MDAISDGNGSATTGPTEAVDQYGGFTPPNPPSAVRTTCRVTRSMNSHGALTVASDSGRRTFNVVEYATPGIRGAMARLRCGASVHVSLIALAGRGESWRVVGIHTESSESHRRRPTGPPA